jgi:hypothetical protein
MDSRTDSNGPPPEANRPTSVLADYPAARNRAPRRREAGERPPDEGPPAPESAGPAASITPPPKLRRRPALIALGIALIALGGLAAGWLTTAVGNTHSVLVMRTTVDRGGVVGAGDVTVARINGDPTLKTVPAGRRDEVIGKRAAVDLAAGSLLTPGSVTDQTVPATGQSLVGVNLSPAQLPARLLRPGDPVRIVSTPRTQDDPPTAEPNSITGTVVGTRFLSDTGRTVVDVSVPSNEAADLAARVATGRVALVLDSGSS